MSRDDDHTGSLAGAESRPAKRPAESQRAESRSGASAEDPVFSSRRAVQLRKMAEQVPGRASVDRPITDERGQGSFPLTYVRLKPAADAAVDAPPLIIIPGGPGLASAVPYQKLRQTAVRRGFDVLMLEHRGVGLSRRTVTGEDLPLSAMRVSLVVDDIRAVLDAEGIQQALLVGSSYGSYVALAFAATVPDRVAGLVLDSPVLRAGNAGTRAWADGLLHDGTVGDDAHRRLARKVRDLARSPGRGGPAAAELARAVRIIFEFAGPDVLDGFLNQVAAGRARTTLKLLRKLGESDTGTPVPFYMEFDRVGEIAFRELHFADADPAAFFDSGAQFTELSEKFSPFSAEPFDLQAALPHLPMPVVALSGDQDLRTPRPTAEVIARTAPRGVLVTVADHGHSALDTHAEAFFAAIDCAVDCIGEGGHEVLAESYREEEVRFQNLKRGGGPSSLVGMLVKAQLAVDRLLPRQR